MAVKFYSHELKLFIVSVLSFLTIHYSTTFYITLPYIHNLPYREVIDVMVNLVVYSFVLSLLTYKLFRENELGKYYIIWFWSIFLNYYFFGVSLYFPFHLGIFTGVTSALLYSIPPSLIMSAVRIKNKAFTGSLPTHQLWAGTVMFASLFLLSLYTGIIINTFIYGALAGLLLSFIAVGTRQTMINLSLIPLFIIAFYYSGDSIYHVTPLTLLLVFGSSLLIFWVSMKPALMVNRFTGEVTPLGVVSSISLSLFFPILVLALWFVTRIVTVAFKHSDYISPLTLSTFPIIFLPTVISSTVTDYFRGKELNKITRYYGGEAGTGIIGGVGLADGLWLDLVGVLAYYLTVLRFGFLDGTILYVVIIVPAIAILLSFA